MASPQDLYINFVCSGNDFNIHLIKDKKSDYSVQINGITYAILGDKDRLSEAHKILNSVALDSVYNTEDLMGRLLAQKEKNISFPEIPITKGIAASILKVEDKEFGAWKLAEDQDLVIKNYVAKCLWSNKDKLSPGLKGLLGEKEVNQAIQTN